MTPHRCAEIHAICFTTPRPWSKVEFSELLTSSAIFLCAQQQGFALGRIAGPEAELLTIAVEPTAQGQGIGHKILVQFENQATARGAEELFLEVAANNTPAIALYSSAGYQKCGQRKDYYESSKGPRISALVFKKTL